MSHWMKPAASSSSFSSHSELHQATIPAVATTVSSPSTGQCPFGFGSVPAGGAGGDGVVSDSGRHDELREDKDISAAAARTSPQSSSTADKPKPQDTAVQERPLTYWDYLHIQKLLSLQPAVLHGAQDELLFITVHQVFELQFKVVIGDLHMVVRLLTGSPLADGSASSSSAALLTTLVTVRRFLERAAALLSWSVAGFDALGLLSAVSFLEFRDHLGSASGFQSLQFRQLEALMGVTDASRPNTAYKAALKEERPKLDRYVEEQPVSLEQALYSWLSQLDIPHIDDFKTAFLAVFTPPAQDSTADDAQRALTATLLGRQAGYASFLSDPEQGAARVAALFVLTYRDSAAWHLHAEVVERALEMEAALLTWRQQHVRLVEKMIGSKPGTGASSGLGYLRATAQQQRLFADLHTVRTMMAAPSKIRFQP